MKINELLIERVVNVFDIPSKTQVAPQVWQLLQQAYQKVPGGFASASSPEELVYDSGLWKLIMRDGNITALTIYKDKHGRKAIASGTDGTPQGKKDFLMIRGEDIKMRRSWAEVSGAPEAIMKRAGAKPLPNKYAAPLTGKEILEYNPDGIHYTRLIAGEPHEKVIYGYVNVTPDTEAKLQAAGISLQELPDNFIK
jgi:hypothetical protein